MEKIPKVEWSWENVIANSSPEWGLGDSDLKNGWEIESDNSSGPVLKTATAVEVSATAKQIADKEREEKRRLAYIELARIQSALSAGKALGDKRTRDEIVSEIEQSSRMVNLKNLNKKLDRALIAFEQMRVDMETILNFPPGTKGLGFVEESLGRIESMAEEVAQGLGAPATRRYTPFPIRGVIAKVLEIVALENQSIKSNPMANLVDGPQANKDPYTILFVESGEQEIVKNKRGNKSGKAGKSEGKAVQPKQSGTNNPEPTSGRVFNFDEE